jgi:Tfp pilus assembly protein PilO
MNLNLEINKHKNKIINIGILLISVLVAYNLYKNQAEGLQKVQHDKVNESKKNEVLSVLGELENALNTFKKELGRKDADSVINYINSIAKETGVSILSIKPDQETKTGEYLITPYMLSLKSSGYHNIGKFVSKLESNNQVFYSVDNLRINPAKEGSGLEISLRLNSVSITD